ncbi:hypothetical protein IWQ47_000994 [Aquimarina sp. EL_43]|uniref:hypothetical protein n=1 Tax=Aquimarina sp. EL_43 TaxID=2787736 RepID=UPI00046FEBD4|nr:hypothetical protein [Aquimarina sp. EL_43]MBG6129704.1 hypothetical protein [Aquimarina sp. EL_35]MBG6150769.1 hypothetical protein [Aquimarina sp. EL_32]MBG6167924.1 hypothetical protein [Aquimarina sp. EL_43]
MKRLLLPIVLITFAVICLSIVHIDNINKLDAQSNELRKKYQTEHTVKHRTNDSSVIIPETK